MTDRAEPSEDVRAWLDLSPARAAALLDAALLRAEAARLREGAGPLTAALDPAARPFAEFVLAELARLGARAEALAQAQAAAALSREERLRLDPLRFIPASRAAAAEAPEARPEDGPVAVEATDPDFTGFGWWQAERTAAGGLRWSGAARCATMLLPALGGGGLLLTLSLRAPFGVPLSLEGQDWFLDGVPLSFATVANDGVTGIFEARVALAPLPPLSRVTLLLHGEQHEDPAAGPLRDTRRLGLGLAWARLERAV